jgi:hypothetical protein
MTTTTINNDHTYNDQQKQQEQLPEFSYQEYESEEIYFNEYDQEMVDAVNEADYYDNQEQEPYIADQSLLQLILDVQSYLSEAPTDSPLFALQYKMYSYLKQRASEMGMDIPSTF